MPAGRKRHDQPKAVERMEDLGALREDLKALMEDDWQPALEFAAVKLFSEGGISPTSSEQGFGVSHSHWYAIQRRYSVKELKNSAKSRQMAERLDELKAVLDFVERRRARKKAKR